MCILGMGAETGQSHSLRGVGLRALTRLQCWGASPVRVDPVGMTDQWSEAAQARNGVVLNQAISQRLLFPEMGYLNEVKDLVQYPGWIIF